MDAELRMSKHASSGAASQEGTPDNMAEAVEYAIRGGTIDRVLIMPSYRRLKTF
jgi:hypothetical protein